MKKQVLTYLKPAKEITAGDLILTNRMTVAKVESVEVFEDSSHRCCVEVGFSQAGQKSEKAMVFLDGETVLVLE